MGILKRIVDYLGLSDDKEKLRTCQDLLSNDFSLFPGKPYINAKVIKYHVFDRTPDLKPQEVDQAIDKVFILLSPVLSPITFLKVDSIREANIVINFASNGDRDLPYEFEPSTLGYAFAPRNNKSTIWLNEAINWGLYHGRDRVNIIKVLLHEVLHSLGVGHTDAEGDIMQPFYSRNDDINITIDTVRAVDTLYSKVKESIPIPKPDEEDEEESSPLLAKEVLKVLFPSTYYVRRVPRLHKNKLAKVIGVDISPSRTLDKRIYERVKGL